MELSLDEIKTIIESGPGSIHCENGVNVFLDLRDGIYYLSIEYPFDQLSEYYQIFDNKIINHKFLEGF